MRTVLLTAALMLTGFLAGCGNAPDAGKPEAKTPEAPAAKTIANTECPVMGGDVDPQIPTAEWNGKTIGFCCEHGKCKEKFLAMNDEDKTKALEGKLK